MYRQATDFFPGSVVWEYVHNTILEHNLTFEQIRDAAVEWGARGYKSENVKGILEWAINGTPENPHANTKEPEKLPAYYERYIPDDTIQYAPGPTKEERAKFLRQLREKAANQKRGA